MTMTQDNSEGAEDGPLAVRAGDEVVAFVRGRSVPCPRCGYELRDLERAQCPECGEPLILRVGTPRMRFGWLVLAMAPGCFSGVAAVILFVAIAGAMMFNRIGRGGMPIPVLCADAFGIVSAASVWLMYRERHRIISMKAARQAKFAAAVWGVHILAFLSALGAMVQWH